MVEQITDVFFLSTGILCLLFLTTVITRFTVDIYQVLYPIQKKSNKTSRNKTVRTFFKKPIQLCMMVFLLFSWMLCIFSSGYLVYLFIGTIML